MHVLSGVLLVLRLTSCGGGATGSVASNAGSVTVTQELQQLASLWRSGALTDSEFAVAKDLVLATPAVPSSTNPPELGAAVRALGEAEVDAAAHATSGTGSAAAPWLGWELAAMQGLPTFFRAGYFATPGITAYNCNLTIPGPRCVGGVRVQWRGSGQTDQTTHPGAGSRGGGTSIVALPPSAGGVSRPLLHTIGVRYVTIEHMTLDGNWSSNATLVIDGPSVTSFGLLDLFLTGAQNITFDIAPTWNTQVSEASVSNCVIQSIFHGDYDKSGDDHHHPGRAQVRVGSTNTLDISFYSGVIDGNGEFNILFEAGGISMYFLLLLLHFFFNVQPVRIYISVIYITRTSLQAR